MIRLLPLLLLISSGCNSQSSNNSLNKASVQLIERFFKNLETKDAAVALEQLLSSNPNISLEDSGTHDLKSKFILINEISGSYMGNRLLKKVY